MIITRNFGDFYLKPSFYFITIFSLLFICSCSNSRLHNATNAKSVSVYLDKEILKDRPFLKIKNDAFDRDFMFYGTFIPMLESASGYSLKGRIVRFARYADTVALLESPIGHAIGDNEENIILLTNFPIVAKDKDGIVVDFSKGMSNAFTTRNVHTSTLGEHNPKAGEQFRAIALNTSFIKSINQDDDVLTLTQIAQWRNEKGELISSEFRYYLREYLPSSKYQKKKQGKNRHIQLFSGPPLVLGTSTENISYMARWLIDKPIVFYLSHNTPEPYKKPIKDGILFWNHIFGKEIFLVKDLEKNIKAPHPLLNIVQWIPWDNEPSAYADMVLDHQTGQILQAQVYVRSGWVMTSGRKLRSQLEKLMLDNSLEENPSEQDMVFPAIFDLDESCQMNLSNANALVDLAEYIRAVEISQGTLQTLSGDILRAVIAHEIGHILGLRHNLASSTVGNISLKERQQMLKEYLKTANPNLGKNKYLTRSIMDVFSAADDALLGSQIREFIDHDYENSPLKKLYSFDADAIAYGYYDKEMPGDSPFCTDEDMPVYLDCRRWDVSPTPLLYTASKLNSGPSYVAMVLAEALINTLDPERAGGTMSFKDVPLNSLKVLKTMGNNGKELFSWFNEQSRSIQIESRFPAMGPHNKDEINQAKWQSLTAQLNAYGLKPTLFSLIPPFKPKSLEPESLAAMTKKHLAALEFEIKEKEPNFILSESQLNEGEKIALSFFSALNTNLNTLMAMVIAQSNFDIPNLQETFESALGDIAKELILKINNAQNSGQIPEFYYPFITREAGAQMLSPTVGLLADWSMDNISLITYELKRLMQNYIQTNQSTRLALRGTPRALRQWILEQNRLLALLSRLKSLHRPSRAPNI